MNWRIYRMPGSREIWHVDAGQGTPVLNVRGYKCGGESYSIDNGGETQPRAWIQVDGQELHIIESIAVFEIPGVYDSVREVLDSLSGENGKHQSG